jgi:hypothetical protein
MIGRLAHRRRDCLATCAAAAATLLLGCAAAAAQSAPQQQLILTPRSAPIAAEPASPVPAPLQVAPVPPPAEAPPPVAMPANRPGFFDALGRWVEDSANVAKSGWDNARNALGGLGGQAGGAAKGAADAASGVAKGAADAASGAAKGAADMASGAAQGVSNAATGAAKGAADAVTRPLTTRFANGRERCVVAGNGAPDCRAAAEHLCKTAGYVGGSSVDMQSAEKCPARVYLVGRQPGDCSMEHYVTRAMCQ